MTIANNFQYQGIHNNSNKLKCFAFIYVSASFCIFLSSLFIPIYSSKAKLLLLKLLQLFARDVLAMKKFEIEKTKPTFIISVLKVDILKVGLVFSISHFFMTKTPLANNWRRKKIPSCSYSALLETSIFSSL